MKLNKRFFSLLLALALIVGMVPVNAMATDSAQSACEHCGVELTEGARHSVACPTYCTCDPKPAEGQAHSTLCPLNLLSKLSAVADYVEEQAAETTTEAPTTETPTTESTTAPTTEPTTEPTTAPATEPTTSPTTEPTTEPTTAPTTEPTTEPTTAPTTEPATEPSTEAKEPSTEATEPTAPEATGPQVGDKIWIKSGSKVYKDASEANSYTLMGNYEVKIVAIHADGQWYEFEFTSLGIGEIALKWGGYKYVHVEDTTTQNPDAQPEGDAFTACDCGENAPENLAQHADTCVRKAAVKAYIADKTAEEIYADWTTIFGETEHTDILNMLAAYDNVKYEALKALVDALDDNSGLDIVYVGYKGVTSSGISANITTPEGAFPEGTTVSVTDTEVSASQIKNIIEDNILGIVAVDISFGGMQPAEAVTVSMDVPASKIPSGANKVIVVHMGSNGNEIVATYYLNTADEGETISFATTGFSSYAAVFVNGKYNSQKMSSVLSGDSRYSLVDFGVDLFDYDPVTINNALDSVTSDGNGFHFTGYGIADKASNNGINNSASEYAKQGILKNTLSNGLPVFNYLTGANAGINTGKVLFSDSEYTTAKTTYNNIPFEFVYDNVTKYYEYKSSANHAQLNDTGTKIELYADTLSTNTNHVATLDLSTNHGENDMTSVAASASSYKATIKNSDGRLDPYVAFTVNKAAASSFDKIYVKAKIPASVGANTFQLYFDAETATGMSESRTYKKAYTPNGDWIEFVIDTGEIAGWNDSYKLTNLRIDLFDQSYGNVDVNGSYPIEISQISLIKETDGYTTRGGFYPFSEIQDSYPGNNNAFSLDAWKGLIQDSTKTNVMSSRAIFNPSPSPTTDLYDELAYGMVMQFDFYLPVNWTGDDLTYYFNGDDDLWVFVDDKLVLDIGGGHGAITGKVNFTTGKWEVANALTVTGYNSGADGTASAKNGSIDASLYTPGKHTMKVFYLERGGSVSNCYMKFNLPRTPTGDVTVSKSVVEENGADTSVLENEEFEFQISAQNQGAGDQTDTTLANMDFIRIDTDGTTTATKTDENGKFTLKHGQEAIFNINENHKVTVTETKKEILGYEYVSTTVNGTEGLHATQVTVENQQKSFDFVNTYKEQQVTITYIPVNPAGCSNDSKGTVELTGHKSTATYAETGVSETIGVRVGVPVGSTATETSAVKFVGWYSDPECTVKIEDDEIFMPTKSTEGELWTAATYYAKFEYKYSSLKITKKITAPEGQTAAAPDQSFRFYVTGGPEDAPFSGYVIIPASAFNGGTEASITIENLRVGDYVVSEDTAWSWRYTCVSEKSFNIDLTPSGETVIFRNQRTDNQWLDGEHSAINVFEGVSAPTA